MCTCEFEAAVKSVHSIFYAHRVQVLAVISFSFHSICPFVNVQHACYFYIVLNLYGKERREKRGEHVKEGKGKSFVIREIRDIQRKLEKEKIAFPFPFNPFPTFP